MRTMPRRAHLALLLLLTLVLAPVTTTLCGARCFGVASSGVSQKQSSHTRCVHLSTCCHGSRQAICQASPAADEATALLNGVSSSAGDHVARIALASLGKRGSQQFASKRNLDAAPPGRDPALSRVPLRI